MSREDILRSLREEFRANTRERLVEMSALCSQLEQVRSDDLLDKLARHFHGLAGLGGTYGYDSVTALSREGENLCENGVSNPDVSHERIASILSALAGAIEEDPDSE